MINGHVIRTPEFFLISNPQRRDDLSAVAVNRHCFVLDVGDDKAEKRKFKTSVKSYGNKCVSVGQIFIFFNKHLLR